MVGMSAYQPLSARIVRRTAAARGHRPRARHPAARAAARRAAVGARRADPPLHGRGDRAAASRSARPDRALCHPRPDRSADARRSHRHHARRQAQSPSAPRDLYREPPNRFAAEFLGRANLLPVELEALEQGGAPGAGALRRPRSARPRARRDLRAGAACLLCVRPHDLAPAAERRRETMPGSGTVRRLLWQGDQHSLDASRSAARACASPRAPLPRAAAAGRRRSMCISPADATLLAIPEDGG